jgi:hypothetical protein
LASVIVCETFLMSLDALLGHLDFEEDSSEPPAFAGLSPSTTRSGSFGRPTWRYLGTPPITERFDDLRQEAAAWRGKAARVNTHLMVEAGPVARAVQTSDQLLAFVRAQVPAGVVFEPTTAYYHWYATEHDRVEPHRDQEDFFLGCILLLNHSHTTAPTCRFYLHPSSGEPIEVPLKEGQVVVFFSGAVNHSRTPPAPGEMVNTLTWGFRLLSK